MNRDDIIRMAREANDIKGYESELFVRFAAIVAAVEREACANLIQDLCDHRVPASVYANAIRARGEQPKRHPGYIVGDHWLQAAYTRVCTGEDVRDVMADYGWYP